MGLGDRNYMHDPQTRVSTRPVWVLIIVNIVIHLANVSPRFALFSDPAYFRFYQLLTAGFIHADFWHLFFNMYGLYLFGPLVARHVKEIHFYALYFIGVIVGNLLYLAVNFGNFGCLVGASGAVCAVMMGAAMFEPERRFSMIFAPTAPLKTPTLVLCYAALEMILEILNVKGSIAHLAHLGGFLGGYVYLKIVFKQSLAWDPLRRNPIRKARTSGFTPPPPSATSGKRVSPAELDALLDKISREGINSLTPEEYARLRQARQEMRGEK